MELFLYEPFPHPSIIRILKTHAILNPGQPKIIKEPQYTAPQIISTYLKAKSVKEVVESNLNLKKEMGPAYTYLVSF